MIVSLLCILFLFINVSIIALITHFNFYLLCFFFICKFSKIIKWILLWAAKSLSKCQKKEKAALQKAGLVYSYQQREVVIKTQSQALLWLILWHLNPH